MSSDRLDNTGKSHATRGLLLTLEKELKVFSYLRLNLENNWKFLFFLVLISVLKVYIWD